MATFLHRPLLWRLAHVAVGVWVGMMIAQAFIGAPLVFGAVPEHIASKDQAGRVIGPGFGRIDVVGLVALTMLLAVYATRGLGRTWRAGLAAVLLAAVAVDAFHIAPQIVARAEGLQTYHRIATGIWMAGILGGLLLLLFPAPSVRD